MQIDGLWTGEFATSEGSFGGGVVFVSGDKIYGGDSGYLFFGTVALDAESTPPTVEARITVQPFIEGFESIFKVKDRNYTLTLTGKFSNDDVVVGYGESPDFPGIRLSMRLTRRKAV